MGVGVAVVGLGFGTAFLPIYLSHPDVDHVAIVDSDPRRLAEVGDRFGIERRHASLDAVLDDPRVDAVHLLTPVAHHARHTIAVLRSGRHCACAVPMATSLEDLAAVIAAQRVSGTTYMMMETSVYGREFLTVRDLHRSGRLGEVTLYRGFHIQNLDGFPRYWLGFPPMAYVTHALSPALALLGTTVESVQCAGSGRLTADRVGDFDNHFPVEVALFRLRDSPVIADVTMSFFQTARAYTEGFCVYGDRLGVEWPQHEDGPLRTFELHAAPDGQRGGRVDSADLAPGDYGHLLPPALADFTRMPDAHGGSHPHLVDAFVSGIVTGRPPAVDAATAANWTAPGIVAHRSAMGDGQTLAVPRY